MLSFFVLVPGVGIEPTQQLPNFVIFVNFIKTTKKPTNSILNKFFN
jgi:hypothetical protein